MERKNTDSYADLVLRNGAIYTVNPAQPWAEAVAIREDRFLVVGDAAEIQSAIGPSTEVIDLDGKMVVPGFFDSHLHPSTTVDLVLSVNLHGQRSLEAYQETIVEFVEAHAEQPVVRGGGWSNTVIPLSGPTKQMLDQVVPEKPAGLRSDDGHSLWVNSQALAQAGITADTQDPPGGVIERDPETGEPLGTLRESAMELVRGVFPEYTTAEYQQGLLAFQEMANKIGITTVLEAHGDDAIPAYQALEAGGKLTVRFRVSLLVEPDAELDIVERLVAERERHRGPLFQTSAAKIFVDGVLEGATAYLLEPYAHRPEYRGELLWDPEHLNRMCAALDTAGFQIHVHAIGDAATRVTLDAFEYAQRQNARRDSRHLITHLHLVDPADIPRFAALGVVGIPQPFWFMVDDYYWNLARPYVGDARAQRQYPMKSLMEAGAIMASGSDFPVTIPFDPLLGIQIGITRSAPGHPIDPDVELKEGEWGVLGPEERATLAAMIASFTINGAIANFLEHETGSIEVGKLADLVVLERNLFQIPVT
jgi:predicted amidohydrolase YtcJ